MYATTVFLKAYFGNIVHNLKLVEVYRDKVLYVVLYD